MLTMLVNIFSPHAHIVVQRVYAKLRLRCVTFGSLLTQLQADKVCRACICPLQLRVLWRCLTSRRVAAFCQLYAPPPFQLSTRWPAALNTMCVTLVYCGGMPFLLPCAFIALTLTYFVEKYSLLRVYAKPPQMGDGMGKVRDSSLTAVYACNTLMRFAWCSALRLAVVLRPHHSLEHVDLDVPRRGHAQVVGGVRPVDAAHRAAHLDWNHQADVDNHLSYWQILVVRPASSVATARAPLRLTCVVVLLQDDVLLRRSGAAVAVSPTASTPPPAVHRPLRSAAAPRRADDAGPTGTGGRLAHRRQSSPRTRFVVHCQQSPALLVPHATALHRVAALLRALCAGAFDRCRVWTESRTIRGKRVQKGTAMLTWQEIEQETGHSASYKMIGSAPYTIIANAIYGAVEKVRQRCRGCLCCFAVTDVCVCCMTTRSCAWLALRKPPASSEGG
jgi:hypothetical protein